MWQPLWGCVCAYISQFLLHQRMHSLARLQSQCKNLNISLCRGEMVFWVWPADILGKNVKRNQNTYRAYVYVHVYVSVIARYAAGPGRLKVKASPCSTSWRAARADGCCSRCTVGLAHASPTAGHWLSGKALPHLLEATNHNEAHEVAGQYKSREKLWKAGDTVPANRQVFFCFFFGGGSLETRIMEVEQNEWQDRGWRKGWLKWEKNER